MRGGLINRAAKSTREIEGDSADIIEAHRGQVHNRDTRRERGERGFRGGADECCFISEKRAECIRLEFVFL